MGDKYSEVLPCLLAGVHVAVAVSGLPPFPLPPYRPLAVLRLSLAMTFLTATTHILRNTARYT